MNSKVQTVTVEDVKKLCGHLVEKAKKVDYETSAQLLVIEDDEEDTNVTAENGANAICDIQFKATGKSFVYDLLIIQKLNDNPIKLSKIEKHGKDPK